MSKQLSIRLDDDVHRELGGDAKGKDVDLATYLRDLATVHAKEIRRARIRAESLRVGEMYRTSPAFLTLRSETSRTRGTNVWSIGTATRSPKNRISYAHGSR